jgi:hypothetical protein
MATLPAYFAQNPDVAAAYKENTYGLTPQEFADTHYSLYGGQEQRAAPPVVQAVTSGNLNSLPTYFQQNPDVAKDYLNNTYGLTPQQFAAEHYARYGQTEQRISPTGAPAVIPPVTPVVRPPVTPVTPVVNRTNTGASLPYFQLNPDVAASYLTNNYGMTPEQFAAAHFAKYGQFEQRSAPSTSPFANATQGFPQSFQNYTSIPIGAQYNQNVVGGTGSPYSQIMGQMRPAGPYNPYMGVASNTPMGGYDPNLYNQIAQANAVAKLAAGTGTTIPIESGGDAPSAPGETGESVSGEYNKGGMVDGLFGMNPPGPDDGAGYLERGEYVIKKSSVDKYGKGLLDMINEGKVSSKKIKSLLD